MNYRVFLLGPSGHILAADAFAARDDADATEIATCLQQACADVFDACELWLGSRRIARIPNGAAHNGFDLARIRSDCMIAPRVRQERLLALEDRLQRSFACVRASRLLLEVRDGLTPPRRGRPRGTGHM